MWDTFLSSDLSEDIDTVAKRKHLCKKANCMLSISSNYDYFTKPRLFLSFRLSLYGCALWKTSSQQLRSLETTFNNILRKIWMLPRHCHTSLLHLVLACRAFSMLSLNILKESCHRLYFKVHFTVIGWHVWRKPVPCIASLGITSRRYKEVDCLCANFICDVTVPYSEQWSWARDTVYVFCLIYCNYIMCSVVCTFSGVFHNIIMMMIIVVRCWGIKLYRIHCPWCHHQKL